MTQTATPAELQIVQVPIDDLHPDPANPRKISDAELDNLTRSLRQFGFLQPVIARHDDHVVIDGHQRLVAARRLGYKTVPTIFVDLSAEQSHLLNLALNRVSGEWDDALLARLLADLQAAPNVDLALSGFEDDEIKRLLRKLDAEDKRHQVESFDLEAALAEAEAQPVTQPGDLWLLGEHRLLCGDSTNEAGRGAADGREAGVVAGHRPALPRGLRRPEPPAVQSQQGQGQPQQELGRVQGPRRVGRLLCPLLKGGLETSGEGQRRLPVARDPAPEAGAWGQCGLLVHQTIVWAKARGVLTRSHYLWSHEPCFYGWVEGQPPKLKPPASERTVWSIDQQGEQAGIHPTQKPVELFIRPIEFHTRPGDVTYEPFSGSGTQIIAAERTGRLCYAMEMEPRYCDVARAKWQAFTREKAVMG